ncbi:MAG: hypothetical protein JSS54_17035 [Proteobacteria bacterium]|nr:hypothetical protein [Pseudomonadota bacterium]
MELLDRLEAATHTTENYFLAYLLKEDINRLRRLEALSRSAPDLETFKKEGSMIGWTDMDRRTWELKASLDPFLEAFYASALGHNPNNASRLDAAWNALCASRMDILVGCLSRVPRPDGD